MSRQVVGQGDEQHDKSFLLRNILLQCAGSIRKSHSEVFKATQFGRWCGIMNICFVKGMYTDSECAIVDGTVISEWVIIRSGVKQRLNMSGFPFLLVID